MLKILLLLLLSTVAFADDDNSNHHQIDFQTTESIKIDNDVMRVTMQIIVVDEDINTVTNSINKRSHTIKNIAQNFNVKLKTTNYHTNPQYHKKAIKNWRGIYAFSIESKNFEQVTKALKKLQKVANYQSVRFLVSTKKRQQAYNQLLVAAISAHQQRGKNIALNFGSKTYQFKQTNFDQQRIQPSRNSYNMKMSLSADVAPAFSAGESSVNITINSTIELR